MYTSQQSSVYFGKLARIPSSFLLSFLSLRLHFATTFAAPSFRYKRGSYTWTFQMVFPEAKKLILSGVFFTVQRCILAHHLQVMPSLNNVLLSFPFSIKYFCQSASVDTPKERKEQYYSIQWGPFCPENRNIAG